MKYLIIFLFLIVCSCSKQVPVTHHEQLILTVPQELLKQPKDLITIN